MEIVNLKHYVFSGGRGKKRGVFLVENICPSLVVALTDPLALRLLDVLKCKNFKFWEIRESNIVGKYQNIVLNLLTYNHRTVT